jgi:chromosome partitioning protein
MLTLRPSCGRSSHLMVPLYLGTASGRPPKTMTVPPAQGRARCHAQGRLSSWFVRLCVKSARFVTSGRSADVPEASIVVAPQVDQDAIGDVIQSLADAVDVVMCDLQGSASVAMLHAIHYADLVLIPVQPSNDDLKSAHSTARHVAQAGKSARREIPYRIVISRASTGFRPEVEKVVEEALENAGIPRLKTPVFERTAFKRASFSRVAPIFDEPTGGAAENIKAVYAEVKAALAETVEKGRGLT